MSQRPLVVWSAWTSGMPRSALTTAVACSPSTATMVIGADALGLGFRFQAHSKAANHAVGGQPVDAILHRTARDFEEMGQGCHRHPGVFAKKRDEPPIGVVH